jgi:hypothetical protein
MFAIFSFLSAVQRRLAKPIKRRGCKGMVAIIEAHLICLNLLVLQNYSSCGIKIGLLLPIACDVFFRIKIFPCKQHHKYARIIISKAFYENVSRLLKKLF